MKRLTKRNKDELKAIVARHEAAGNEPKTLFPRPLNVRDDAMEHAWADIEFLLKLLKATT